MSSLDYLYARQRHIREELAKERINNPGMSAMASSMERELMQIYEDINRMKGEKEWSEKA